MKEIRDAVKALKHYKPTNNEIAILIDLAEKVLAVKMPERSNEPAFYCPMEILSHAEYKGRKEAIEQCTLAITGALLSESDIINIFNHYFNKMEAKHSKAIMDGDWGTNGSWFTNAGEMFNELAKQIHSAQVEKLMGKKYKIKSIVGDKQCMEELKYPYQILESVIELEEVEEVKEVEEKWNENVEECSDCGIKWKKIGKSCPVCFAPAENEMNNSPKGLTGRGD